MLSLVYPWWVCMTFHAYYSVTKVFTPWWDIDTRTQKTYDIYSKIYTTMNAFRSVLPRRDVERTCLFPLTISSPFVGRSLATVAELAFACQLSKRARDPFIVYCASIAQLYCWIGVLTQNNWFHICEESLWLLIGIRMYKRLKFREILVYCAYMMCIDIPMYCARFVEDTKSHKPYLSLMYGLEHSMTCVHSDNLSMWYADMIWMTGYFVVATHFSMLLSR